MVNGIQELGAVSGQGKELCRDSGRQGGDGLWWETVEG